MNYWLFEMEMQKISTRNDQESVHLKDLYRLEELRRERRQRRRRLIGRVMKRRLIRSLKRAA